MSKALFAEHARTLHVIERLAAGEYITLGPDMFAMGEDMRIGPINSKRSGNPAISNFRKVDLAEFNQLLNKHNIMIGGK